MTTEKQMDSNISRIKREMTSCQKKLTQCKNDLKKKTLSPVEYNKIEHNIIVLEKQYEKLMKEEINALCDRADYYVTKRFG